MWTDLKIPVYRRVYLSAVFEVTDLCLFVCLSLVNVSLFASLHEQILSETYRWKYRIFLVFLSLHAMAFNFESRECCLRFYFIFIWFILRVQFCLTGSQTPFSRQPFIELCRHYSCEKFISSKNVDRKKIDDYIFFLHYFLVEGIRTEFDNKRSCLKVICYTSPSLVLTLRRTLLVIGVCHDKQIW